MITLLLFDDVRCAWIVREMDEEAQMPYIDNLRFSVADFCYGAKTSVCWSTVRALTALNRFAEFSRVPFFVRGGFRRIQSGAFPFGAPQHTGTAFHCRATEPARAPQLIVEAQRAIPFLFCRPPYRSSNDTYVFVSSKTVINMHAVGTEVLALQDALLLMGFAVTLTGYMDAATQKAIARLQVLAGLPVRPCVRKSELHQIVQLTSAYQSAKIKRNQSFCLEVWHGL